MKIHTTAPGLASALSMTACFSAAASTEADLANRPHQAVKKIMLTTTRS